MESAEEFIVDFIRERAVMLKKEQESFTPFRRKFYSDDCELGRRRAEKLKELLNAAEKVVRVRSSEKEAEVFTVSSDGLGTTARLRYRLDAMPEGWLIMGVDLECPVCRGAAGDHTCSICGGNGWHDFLRDRRTGGPSASPRRRNIPPPNSQF